MSIQALMYHDVVPTGQFDLSGFRGHHADHYKLTTTEFEEHLREVIAAAGGPSTFEPSAVGGAAQCSPALLLTFDDGGVSALTEIAPRLEALGCRGYFFVTTDRIGERGFLSEKQLRELASREHTIGSHTCSHPARISSLSTDQLHAEWLRSRDRLEAILGRSVTTASIPGGYYSTSVATAAMACGYTELFTSEPTARTWTIGSMRVYGRYAITRLTSAAEAASLARGRSSACSRQWLAWNARKAVKRITGPLYEPVRRMLLRAT